MLMSSFLHWPVKVVSEVVLLYAAVVYLDGYRTCACECLSDTPAPTADSVDLLVRRTCAL